jgi:hypothetical protein
LQAPTLQAFTSYWEILEADADQMSREGLAYLRNNYMAWHRQSEAPYLTSAKHGLLAIGLGVNGQTALDEHCHLSLPLLYAQLLNQSDRDVGLVGSEGQTGWMPSRHQHVCRSVSFEVRASWLDFIDLRWHNVLKTHLMDGRRGRRLDDLIHCLTVDAMEYLEAGRWRSLAGFETPLVALPFQKVNEESFKFGSASFAHLFSVRMNAVLASAD